MNIFATILAGGEGRRLGFVDKAGLRLGNQTLLQHAITNARAQTNDIALSHPGLSIADDLNQTKVLPDPFQPPIGPLGGIYAGALWAQTQIKSDDSFLLTMPVDTPFFPKDFTQKASELITNADIVVGRYHTQLYPACALWRLDTALHIKTGLQNNTNYAIRAFFENFTVAELDYGKIQTQNPFENINEISDLLQLSAKIPTLRASL